VIFVNIALRRHIKVNVYKLVASDLAYIRSNIQRLRTLWVLNSQHIGRMIYEQR